MLPKVFESVRIVVRPAGPTPGSRDVQIDRLALVKQVVQIVRDPVDVGGCKVGRDAAIGQLRLRH